jgi:ketosteroid isomerase-like protein
MHTSATAQAAHRLVAAINSRDADAVAARLSSDHRFIDTLGVVICGRESLRAGWRQYFRLVPDYHIELQQLLSEGELALMVGTAGGTYSGDGTLQARNAWSAPSAFRALVREGLVSEWQVYADNEPIRRCMRAAGARHD